MDIRYVIRLVVSGNRLHSRQPLGVPGEGVGDESKKFDSESKPLRSWKGERAEKPCGFHRNGFLTIHKGLSSGRLVVLRAIAVESDCPVSITDAP